MNRRELISKNLEQSESRLPRVKANQSLRSAAMLGTATTLCIGWSGFRETTPHREQQTLLPAEGKVDQTSGLDPDRGRLALLG